MGANLFSKLPNLLNILVLKVLFCQTTIGFDQTLRKIHRSIAHDMFYLVKYGSYLLWSELGMIEEGDKRVNGLLKVDIVLPKCVICINQEMISHVESFQIKSTSNFCLLSYPLSRLPLLIPLVLS